MLRRDLALLLAAAGTFAACDSIPATESHWRFGDYGVRGYERLRVLGDMPVRIEAVDGHFLRYTLDALVVAPTPEEAAEIRRSLDVHVFAETDEQVALEMVNPASLGSIQGLLTVYAPSFLDFEVLQNVGPLEIVGAKRDVSARVELGDARVFTDLPPDTSIDVDVVLGNAELTIPPEPSVHLDLSATTAFLIEHPELPAADPGAVGLGYEVELNGGATQIRISVRDDPNVMADDRGKITVRRGPATTVP